MLYIFIQLLSIVLLQQPNISLISLILNHCSMRYRIHVAGNIGGKLIWHLAVETKKTHNFISAKFSFIQQCVDVYVRHDYRNMSSSESWEMALLIYTSIYHAIQVFLSSRLFNPKEKRSCKRVFLKQKTKLGTWAWHCVHSKTQYLIPQTKNQWIPHEIAQYNSCQYYQPYGIILVPFPSVIEVFPFFLPLCFFCQQTTAAAKLLTA